MKYHTKVVIISILTHILSIYLIFFKQINQGFFTTFGMMFAHRIFRQPDLRTRAGYLSFIFGN